MNAITNEVGIRYERPWGSYETLEQAETFQVKKIILHPGGMLSLQRHQHRAEYWTVVEGQLRVTVDNDVRDIEVGGVVAIPKNTIHRAHNCKTQPVIFIEVQLGSYFGEDDIERLDDIYGRA